MARISFAELDAVSGEILPERAALSLIDLSGASVNVLNSSTSDSYSFSGGHGTFACQATSSPGTPGLMGALGLGSANPNSSVTCIPVQ